MASEAITRNDLKNVLDAVLPVYSGAIHKVLYDSGSSKVSSGTLTLSEPYTNFDYLIVSYLVNVDAYTETFDCTRMQAYPSHTYHGDIVIYNGNTVYASTCKFTVTDATHLAVTNSGNNANFTSGIVRVVGVKNPFVQLDAESTTTHLGSGSNLNSLTGNDATGFYYITTGVSNSPVEWATLLVIGGIGTSQIIFNVNTIYMRMYTGSPLTWSAWRYYTLPNVLS